MDGARVCFLLLSAVILFYDSSALKIKEIYIPGAEISEETILMGAYKNDNGYLLECYKLKENEFYAAIVYYKEGKIMTLSTEEDSCTPLTKIDGQLDFDKDGQNFELYLRHEKTWLKYKFSAGDTGKIDIDGKISAVLGTYKASTWKVYSKNGDKKI